MTALWLPLAGVAGILLAAAAAGYALAAFFILPSSPRAERAAWGFALGLALLSASVPLAFLTHVPPRWMAIVLLAIAATTSLSRRKRNGVRGSPSPTIPKSKIQNPRSTLLLALIALGVFLHLVRALAEPMWSNDFLAIWGFKGKTIFASASLPRRLFADPSLGFSHPEYPLGLPLLYAAISFLLGRWDDQALALLFPLLQIATLLVLTAWLLRRGVPRTLALGAAALLANLEPLYSAFLAGMADIPFSFAALLLGTSLADSLEETDPLALRRLALSAGIAVSTKNEGLLLAGAVAAICALAARKARAAWRGALAAVLAPALVLFLGGRIWKGRLPLRDFDFGYLGPTGVEELLPRVAEAIHAAFREVILPSWPGVLCVAVLIGAGRRSDAGDRLLAIAAVCALGYLLVPSLAVLGPDWLIRTSFARTTSALAPLAAAGIAIRLRESERW